MAGLGLTVSPGFLLLASSLYFFGGGASITAFFTAALAHELGHLIALALSGARVCGVRITAAGPVIRYGGELTGRQEAGIAAAGPVAGLLFAVLLFRLGSEYFSYVGIIALLATAFNLLPVLPLDGGRMAQYLLETSLPPGAAAIVLQIIGSLCALGVFLTGLRMCSPAAAAIGIWMAVLANKPELR